MNKYLNKTILSYILFFALFFFATNCAIAEYDQLDNQREKVEAQRNKATQQIKKIKLMQKVETNRLYKNQQKLESAEHSLQKNQREYTNANDEIHRLENKLNELVNEHRTHLNYTSKRIVQIFKHKRNSYIEFLLSAKDINSFLDRLYFENIIITYDKKKLKETKAVAQQIYNIKDRIEKQKRTLAYSIALINRQKGDIEDAISKNEELIKKLQTDLATWQKAEKDLARQSKAISQMINQETKKTQKDGVSINITGGFVRPVPGRISSPYGSRIHPIFKRKIFHSGIDIAAPYGTPIKAANSGRVIFVGWYSGYGRVVIIDHGNINGVPTTTLYAHMSQAVVKQGVNVARGATIGKVGTTGYSTGPHLHFEVRQKGNTVNPLSFIR